MNDRAGFGRRFPALLLDVILILILSLPFGKPVSRLLSALGVPLSSFDTSGDVLGTLLFNFWAVAVLYLLVEVLTEATPGKRALKLRIAREDGQPASAGRRLGRYAGKVCFLLVVPPFGMTEVVVVLYAFFALAAICFLGTFLMFGPRKQTLYDRLSKTAVFRR
jgi:uncharacterized RDD family membrane protein YckC